MRISSCGVGRATWRGSLPAVVSASAIAFGCAANAGHASPSAPARAVEPGPKSSSSARVPDLSPGPTAQAPFASDPLWRDAERGDPIDLQRLARREGSTGLLAGIEAGRSVGLTALGAIPYADDAELALGRLCEIARDIDPKQVRPVLGAIHGIVAEPPKTSERLDVHGPRACAKTLEALSRSERHAPGERDLATSARALLKEHHP
jgi:hypothetical protein